MVLVKHNDFDFSQKIFNPDQSIDPSFKYFDDVQSIPENYSEVTDIEQMEYGGKALDHIVNKLYLKKKLKIAIMAKMTAVSEADLEIQGKWDLLDDPIERSIATHWFICQKESFQLLVVNDVFYWDKKSCEYRLWTNEIRGLILAEIEALLFNRCLNRLDVKITIDSIKSLSNRYLKGLVESLAKDGVEGIGDYYNSEVGTSFDPNNNGGFRQVGYSFKNGYTVDSVADEVLVKIDGY